MHNEKKQHTQLEVRLFVRMPCTLSRDPVRPPDACIQHLAQDDPIYQHNLLFSSYCHSLVCEEVGAKNQKSDVKAFASLHRH